MSTNIKNKQVRKGQLMQWVVIISFIVLTALSSHSFARFSLDRDAVKEIVVEEAKLQGVDPALVLAVAQVESDFDPNVVSHKGARGVMQIMPKTARDEFGINPALLFDARTNIRTGVTFLKQLQNRYGKVEFALSHYNGGSRVTKPDGSYQVIPVTRGYVDKVLSKMKTFQQYETPSWLAYTPSYRDMKEKAKDNLGIQSKLYRLRQKNMHLAKVVNTRVDSYLDGYRSGSTKGRGYTSDQRERRQQVLQWESIYER
ncbi:hypothetical protein A9Q81_19085 [Gammaproteobacteria bacterium 42_54_T18]|nr:hypothetical protein A9Q81_19085 [Gammaproteobacteria bacterium 42_54_T18]